MLVVRDFASAAVQAFDSDDHFLGFRRGRRLGLQHRADIGDDGGAQTDGLHRAQRLIIDRHGARFAHAARAEMCRRLGRTADARASSERALALARQEPERRCLEKQIAGLGKLGIQN